MILGMQWWVFWLILTAIFAIIEIATINLVTIWFAGGSLAAMIAALLGAEPMLQILIAVGVSGILLAVMLIFKPFSTLKSKAAPTTNSDRVIGQEGIVLTAVDPIENSGTVRVMGQIWSAHPADERTLIPEGTHITVKAITGVKLMVEPVDPQSKGE